MNIIYKEFVGSKNIDKARKDTIFRRVLRDLRRGYLIDEKDLQLLIQHYINYEDEESSRNAMKAIFNALQIGNYKNFAYLDDLQELFYENNNDVSQQLVLDAVAKRIARTNGIILPTNLSNNLDGKIDNFKQGAVGDCWLLAGITGIVNNNTTRAIIEKECLKTDENGNRVIRLLGVDKEYTITKKELEANSHFSKGEDDVRAIEIAFEKFFIENEGYKDHYYKTGISGGFPFDACKILLGNAIHFHDGLNGEISDDKINDFNSRNLICYVVAHGEDKEEFYPTQAEKIFYPNKKIIPKHAYYVARADEENVYLVNPWDTSQEIGLSREKFKEYFNHLEIMKVNDTEIS